MPKRPTGPESTMMVDRYDPVNLFEMVPKLKLEFEPELAILFDNVPLYGSNQGRGYTGLRPFSLPLFSGVRGIEILGSSASPRPYAGFLCMMRRIPCAVHKKPIIPQASITLPCLPGLSFAGLREEQESERFRVASN